jgi:outer membrane lipase/esterase
MADAVGAIGDGIVSLVGAGIENFMVFNVPPFEATPAFTQENPAAAPLAAYAAGVYNALLAQQLAGLAGVADIELFDANLAFLDVLTDPAAYGISNVADACLDPPAICPDPDSYMFWDNVHPTATIHAEIADRVRASVAPVPLPASLLLVVVAAAALGGVGLRRRA